MSTLVLLGDDDKWSPPSRSHNVGKLAPGSNLIIKITIKSVHANLRKSLSCRNVTAVVLIAAKCPVWNNKSGVFTVSYRNSNPSHRASYRAVWRAVMSVLTHPCVRQAGRQAGARLHTTVDDMCCQLSGENSLLRYRLFPAWLGTERVTGQGVYWNTVFSSAVAAVQLQYSRNIVLLCGCFPRPAP